MSDMMRPFSRIYADLDGAYGWLYRPVCISVLTEDGADTMSIETRLLDWTKEGLIGADDARASLALEEMRMAAAEIERLRGLLGDVQIIMDSHNNIVGNLNAEIERLRGLLREAHLALSFMPDPTRKLLDLRYRVREALGE